MHEAICLGASDYAKETSRLSGKGCQLLVALLRSLMQMIPMHSCSGGGGDEYVGPAWLNGTSGYLLALLYTFADNNDPSAFSRRGGGGWVDRLCVTG